MTKKQVWRYYCDYCHKGSLAGGHMKTHECGCTANPERVCRMHAHFPDTPQRSIKELMAAFNSRLPDYGMEKLRELTGGCPMCILAAIRQSGICKWDGDPENAPPDLKFDYKMEVAAAWKVINKAKAQDKEDRYDAYSSMY